MKLLLLVTSFLASVVWGNFRFFKTYATIYPDLEKDCPSTKHAFKNLHVNKVYFCASICGPSESCHGFSKSGDGCTFYSVVINPAQEGATGDVEVFTKLWNPLQDVLRNKHPLTLDNTEYMSSKNLTQGVFCITGKSEQSVWCKSNPSRSVKFDLGTRFRIREVVISKRATSGNDFTKLTIRIGDNTLRNNPIFSKDLYAERYVAATVAVTGDRAGRYLEIDHSASDNYMFCAVSIEAYGEPLP